MNTLTSVSPVTASETELLALLTADALSNEFPFALWKLPSSSSKHLLIANQYKNLQDDFVLEDLKQGFIFSSFDSTRKIYLPADFLFSFEAGKLVPADDPVSRASVSMLEKKLELTTARRPVRITSPIKGLFEDNNDDQFLGLIRKGISEAEKGTFEKVVPSRTKTVVLPPDFDVLNAFQKLCERYPLALVSLVNIPGVGCWLGATPEILVSVENKSQFKTVALAGTQPYREGMNLRNVAWTQKEIEEQALVERYVISCFKKIRLREYEEHGPKTVVAGNLIHLKSDFMVDMKETNFPNLGTTMLSLLHPTSAVCGMPLEPARAFLRENEKYDRSFYSGYLGPVNVNDDVHIFVNLRCMQIGDQQGILYAGAGVTPDSIAEQELEETEMKFNTLLNVVI
jgi:isochorismate synthase